MQLLKVLIGRNFAFEARKLEVIQHFMCEHGSVAHKAGWDQASSHQITMHVCMTSTIAENG